MSLIGFQGGMMALGGFTPAQLFASGERGAWYDPSDFSTMFQDEAGTTPVTGTGQVVRKLLDKSGNNNHATNASGTLGLQQDGSGNYYLYAGGDSGAYLSAGSGSGLAPRLDHMTAVAGFKLDDTAPSHSIFARSEAAAVAGRYALNKVSSSVMAAIYDPDGSGGAVVGLTDSDISVRVSSMEIDRAGSTVTHWMNGAAFGSPGSFPADGSTDQNSAYRFLIAAYNDATDTGQINFLNGRIYGIVVRFAALDGTLRAKTEQWMAGKSGISF